MGARRHLLYLLYTSSARPPTATPYFITAPPPFLFHKGYNHERSNGNHVAEGTIINHEKAPSTLEEFKRLEEEKASEGVVSQTVDKVEDGVMEATTGDGSVESVKESFKKASGVDDIRRTGDIQSTK